MMRMRFEYLGHSRAIAVIALALLAASCSRSLPTAAAPAASVVRGSGADLFATQGLENQVAVTLAPGVDAADIATQYGASIVNSESGERTAALRPVAGQTALGLMSLLAGDSRIITSEPNGWMEPAEARQQSFAFDDGAGTPETYVEQPAAQALELERAHEVATGRGVKVAIIDTGADMHHPLLRRQIVGGWDFVDEDANPTDQRDFVDNDRDGRVDEAFGHGTHVAGIIRLVAPDAQLLIVRVLDADGRGDIVNVAAGVRWAMDHGARVINLSLGSLRSSDALQNALEDAENAGITISTSAGNWGASIPEEFPARSSHVTCVAAVAADDSPAPFSSFGGKVALSAPGVGIRSTYPGGGFRLWSGTSMAAPFVAGTAALLLEKHPEWTMLETSTRMETTADKVTGAAKDTFGAGALSVGRALAPDFVLVPGPDQTPTPEEIRPH